MSSLETAFAVCAGVGGAVLVLRFVLQLFGVHHDAILDVHDAGLDAGQSDAGFRILSLQGITAFLMMFGLVGFALVRANHVPAGVAIGGALLAGVATAWLVALLWRAMMRLQSAGNDDPRQAVGQRGSVYLTIPAGGTGKVSVNVNNRLSVLDAVAQDKLEIKTGAAVEVVEIFGTNVLAVKKA